jgi:ABC-type transport system involved in multi-copper enzyme maturation permease subunit
MSAVAGIDAPRLGPTGSLGDAPALIGADLLKLRRRRGLLALAVGLTAGAVLLLLVGVALRHAVDSTSGAGLGSFSHAVDVLGLLLAVVAPLLGATVGAGDAEAGVLGELVATGRPRLALYLARVPAMVAACAAIALLGVLVAAAGSALLLSSEPQPGGTAIARDAGAAVAFALCGGAIGIGAGAIAASRGIVVVIAAVGQLVVAQILAQVSWLGAARDLLPTAAFGQLEQFDGRVVSMPTAVALAVLAIWSLAFLWAGALWTRMVEL